MIMFIVLTTCLVLLTIVSTSSTHKSLIDLSKLLQDSSLRSQFYSRLLSSINSPDSDFRSNAIFTTKPQTSDITQQINSLLNQSQQSDHHQNLLYVPIIIKDNINTVIYPTTLGSKGFASFIPTTGSNISPNATVVNQLTKQGVIVFGKANLHEFAQGITNNNQYFGAVRNPFNKDYIAGGSSGGTAAAVAYGLVHAGLGTDTGGSIRIPASFCGIVGFRPTVHAVAIDYNIDDEIEVEIEIDGQNAKQAYGMGGSSSIDINTIASGGRYDSDGVFLLSHTLDAVGIMGRTVRDVRIVDGVIKLGNKDLNDIEQEIDINESINTVNTSYSYSAGTGVEKTFDKIRIGIPKQHFHKDLHPLIDNSFTQTISLLQKEGKADGVSISLVFEDFMDKNSNNYNNYSNNGLTGDRIIESGFNIVFYEFPREASYYNELFNVKGDNTVRNMIKESIGFEKDIINGFFDSNSEMFDALKISNDVYHRSLNLRNKLIDVFRKYMSDNLLDFIVYPTVTVLPPLIDKEEEKIESNGKQFDTFPKVIQNTFVTAIIGMPCITVQGCYRKQETIGEFPIGFDICGLHGHDDKLLQFAQRVENILDKAENCYQLTKKSVIETILQDIA